MERLFLMKKELGLGDGSAISTTDGVVISIQYIGACVINKQEEAFSTMKKFFSKTLKTCRKCQRLIHIYIYVCVYMYICIYTRLHYKIMPEKILKVPRAEDSIA